MTKDFPTVAVCGVATGIVLVDKGMSEIHEVMDHLFPGIFTLGCAAMQPAASNEIYRQLPGLKEFVIRHGDPPQAKSRLDKWVKLVVGQFGQTLPVDGPLGVSREEVDKAFDAIMPRPT